MKRQPNRPIFGGLLCAIVALFAAIPSAWAPNRAAAALLEDIAYKGPAGCRVDTDLMINEPQFQQKLQTLIDKAIADKTLCKQQSTGHARIWWSDSGFFQLTEPLNIINSIPGKLVIEKTSLDKIDIGRKDAFAGTCGIRIGGDVEFRNFTIAEFKTQKGICVVQSGPLLSELHLLDNNIGVGIDASVEHVTLKNSSLKLNRVFAFPSG